MSRKKNRRKTLLREYARMYVDAEMGLIVVVCASAYCLIMKDVGSEKATWTPKRKEIVTCVR